jgi:hypothetical protein
LLLPIAVWVPPLRLSAQVAPLELFASENFGVASKIADGEI